MLIGIFSVFYCLFGSQMECWVDIYICFGVERIFFFGFEVNDGIVNSLVVQMFYFDLEDSSKLIYLYINFFGGFVIVGLVIYDIIQYVKSEVVIICVGFVVFMGVFFFVVGIKGKWVVLFYSWIMIYQFFGGISCCQVSDIEIEVWEILWMKEMFNCFLVDMSGQSFEKIEKDIDWDYFFSVEEVKEYGLIDCVIFYLNEV